MALWSGKHKTAASNPTTFAGASREHAAEAEPLAVELRRIQDGHRRGPQLLGDILPIMLARLGGVV
jgi:hypothetical protein